MSKVKANDTVKVHYTGKLDNGQIFDSSVDREPLEVTLGQGMLIPGFEKGLIDLVPKVAPSPWGFGFGLMGPSL